MCVCVICEHVDECVGMNAPPEVLPIVTMIGRTGPLDTPPPPPPEVVVDNLDPLLSTNHNLLDILFHIGIWSLGSRECRANYQGPSCI